jgi:hypothetical protein
VIKPSIRSIFITALSKDEALGTATGFIVTYKDRPYLITNYHVVSGRNPRNGQPSHRSGAVPDRLRIFLPVTQRRPDQVYWEEREVKVYDEDLDQSFWIEHHRRGRQVDVAAVPLGWYDEASIIGYDLSPEGPGVRVQPPVGVSIVGFPFGLTGSDYLAIWTRGFVASEPEVDLYGLPFFLVDARTRRGQSGSPVIYFDNGGMSQLADGDWVIGGNFLQLLGIYSGRINEQSDLGIVWKHEAILEVLQGQAPGQTGLANRHEDSNPIPEGPLSDSWDPSDDL